MSSSLFGYLVHRPGDGVGYNGLNVANQSFLKAIIRYSQFSELHLFLVPADIKPFKTDWQPYFDTYGSGKQIKVLSVNQLPESFSTHTYTVFHSGDPYISDLVLLREHHAETLFPVVGRAHTLSDDTRLSRSRDLILAPVKSCDTVLCSSNSQMQVMKRLLSSASASLSNALAIALPYRGQLDRLAQGMEMDSPCQLTKAEARQSLNQRPDQLIILCLGRLSASDKMDLHPLLLALNDVVEERGIVDFLLVVAGTADAGDPYIQSLIKRAYELNLEEKVRFELSVDDEQKDLLLRSADIFVSVADNIQESFGLTPLEAMRESMPVVLSDWDGYKELIEDGVSGLLVPTSSVDLDELTRSLSLINASQARFIKAQATAVDVDALAKVVAALLTDSDYRESLGKAGRLRLAEQYDWTALIQQYHELVSRLQKEAQSIPFRSGRPVGISLQSTFGHYPSDNVEKTQYLCLTDRGLRVLLQAEHGFFFSELQELLDQQQLYPVLEACVEPVAISDLMQQFSDMTDVSFILQWMRKYQLLQLSESESESVCRPVVSLDVPDKELPVTVFFPEQRRGQWFKPFLAQCLEYLEPVVKPLDPSGAVLKSYTDELVNLLDESMLQGIGWFAKKRELVIYNGIMDTLEKEGGLAFLISQYPVWYRNRCRLVLRLLRSARRLMTRLEKDLPALSTEFQDLWSKDARHLTGIQVINVRSQNQTVILTLDNSETLVYKDRDLRIDNALVDDRQSLGNWVNKQLTHSQLGLHRVVCCQDGANLPGHSDCKRSNCTHYGYSQYLQSGQSVLSLSPEQAADYYCNLGSLMGFALFTGLADLHQLNFIHHGPVLYLIDAETAFNSSVLRHLGEELNNPTGLLLKGFADSSFEATGLYQLWQAFHTSRLNCCSVTLKNGQLQNAESLVFSEVAGHLLQVSGVSVLDAEGQNLASQYTSSLLTGFRKVLDVIGAHSLQWRTELDRMSGFAVRYQPLLNVNELRKQLRDISVSAPLQNLPPARLKGYVGRVVKRTTLAAEAGQKWLSAPWFEPVDQLVESLTESLLNLDLPSLTSVLGEQYLLALDKNGTRKVIVRQFFQQDFLTLAQQYSEQLADLEVRERLVNGYQIMLESWLTKELKPGEDMPEVLKAQLLNHLQGEQGGQP